MSSSKPQQPYRDDAHDTDEVNAAFATPTRRSIDSTSTTSLILERIHPDGQRYDDPDASNEKHGAYPESDDEDLDIESGAPHMKPMENKVKRYVYIIAGVLVGGWLLALLVYLGREAYNPGKAAAAINPITIEQIHTGMWRPRKKGIQWISGESDGLMLVPDGDEGYLEVQDVRNSSYKNILMKHRTINVGDVSVAISRFWPSPDLKKVLVASHIESHWRHSFYARYFILDVETQIAEPLVPNKQEEKIALAVWAPTSDAIAYVVDNNIRIREINNQNPPIEVTKDGSKDLFYGIPDWVYEEEVFAGATAMWWSENGKHLAFLRTNETEVPEYPLQYFASRPSGKMPKEGLENYPELDFIKYPKAGAPNPVVDLQFFDLARKQVFSVNIKNDFPDDDRLITEVVWAGNTQVLIRETNRESDLLRMILIDVSSRSGKVAREVNVAEIDGGWFEVSQSTRYIPADPSKGRNAPGYIDTVIHDGYDHLAYFSPLDAKDPVLLTKGDWEVVDAPSGIDLNNGLVYFVSTQRSSIERHVYSVKLDGTDLKPITNTTQDGFYDVSYSKEGGYALLTYDGPGIPWQKVIGMPAVDASFTKRIEDNKDLKELSTRYTLPTFHYSTINIDGFDLNVVERRPPNFDENKKYPVIFHVYGGPGSQQVQKAFKIDFQAYMAGGLDYLVVTVDGRGTGFIGRKARVAVRGNLGNWESHDQIATAKHYASLPYVDASRIAIWGWSYGGFMTLKTLEQDAGNTFSYGMAVAPVTDWRYYDSIYTERYMHTPQHNPQGYNNATIKEVERVGNSTRFLLMHGVADDNVHFQNSLTLLDEFDLRGVENYDFHAFPDSDHSIYFHNANRMVYDRLNQWIIRAFNGEYKDLDNLKPKGISKKV